MARHPEVAAVAGDGAFEQGHVRDFVPREVLAEVLAVARHRLERIDLHEGIALGDEDGEHPDVRADVDDDVARAKGNVAQAILVFAELANDDVARDRSGIVEELELEAVHLHFDELALPLQKAEHGASYGTARTRNQTGAAAS
jgi:hypothetical protein